MLPLPNSRHCTVMKHIPSILRIAFAALLCWMPLTGVHGQGEPRPRPDGIVFPASSAAIGVAAGTVEVMVAVDDKGNTASVTVLASTHKGLEDAVRAAIEQWKFEPASNGGQATIGMYRHAFHFKDGSFDVDEKLLESLAGAQSEPTLRADGVELPVLPASVRDVTGQVELLAAVDSFGRVVDITTESSTDAKLEEVLRGALAKWVFDPVTRDGKPVAGVYRHQFKYENGQHFFTQKLWSVLSAVGNEPTLKSQGLVLPQLVGGLADITGNVNVMIAVNREGQVIGFVSVAATDEDLAAAVKKAVTQWTFEPASNGSRPVVGFYRHGFQFDNGQQVFDPKLWSVLTKEPSEPTLLAEGLELPELPADLADVSVKLDVLIAVDPSGKVASLTPVAEADDKLFSRVNDSVRKWSFAPAQRSGKAVIGLYRHTFRFEDGKPLFDEKLWRVLSSAASSSDATPVAAAVEPEKPAEVKSAPEPASMKSEVASAVGPKDPRAIDLKDYRYEVARRVEPDLPEELRNIRGQISMILELRDGGAVKSVSTEYYTHEELIDPAMRACFAWRFAVPDGAINDKIRVPFSFNENPQRVNWSNLIDAQYGKVDTKPEVIRSVVPKIPVGQSHVKGEIQALIAIDKYGYVTQVEIERGLGRSLDRDAESALYQWKLTPAKVAGRPIESKLRQTFLVGGGVAKVEVENHDTQAVVKYSPSPKLRGATARIQGFVLVRLRVDERGQVTDARVINSTNNRLEDPSVEVSREWKFSPALSNGTPVTSTVVVPFIYPMEDA